MKKILLTGGAGYIGSHIAVELLQSNYEVVIVDNFSTSKPSIINNIKLITGKDLALVKGDVRDFSLMNDIFAKNDFYAVIHLAGYKAVAESVQNPINYYDNNLISTISLLKAMKDSDCRKIIFSSSATVYGEPKDLPLIESSQTLPVNPYGRTKLAIENILKDVERSDNSWRIVSLRYFNPVASHPSGLINEDSLGAPNNLFPILLKVAKGELDCIQIFGNDYPTKDGTAKRDYIHIKDLSCGHLAALEKIENIGYDVFNIGTGKSHSVLEVLNEFENALGKSLNKKIAPRREGDAIEYLADVSYAKKILGFQTTKTLKDMCQDAVRHIK